MYLSNASTAFAIPVFINFASPFFMESAKLSINTNKYVSAVLKSVYQEIIPKIEAIWAEPAASARVGVSAVTEERVVVALCALRISSSSCRTASTSVIVT